MDEIKKPMKKLKNAKKAIKMANKFKWYLINVFYIKCKYTIIK